MKLLNKRKTRFLCLITALLSLCLTNMPAFSAERPVSIKSINELEDTTIQGLARQDLNYNDSGKLSYFNKTNGLIRLESDIKFFPENLTIDLTLRDVDVASILRIIAKEGHKNIVIDQSVMGNVTAELKKISLNQAMQVILTSEELEARLSNGTIFVASRPAMATKGLNRRYIKTFKLNNSNPVEVAQILEASIFNKGYKVEEKAGGSAMAAATSSQDGSEQPSQTASSAGQSSLVATKAIKGRVEELAPGESFGDAGKLASTIKIQQTSASTQQIQINNNDGGAIVIPDTRTNSILVAGLQEDIAMAEATIKTLDKPLRQVSIEVSLIELKKENQNDLGLTFNSQRSSISGGFNTVGLPGYNFSSLTNQAGIMLNTMDHFSLSEFSVGLNNLLQNKKAKLLANPRIVALDGSESLIKITDQVVSKVTTTVTQTSISYNTEVADVGIVLNILPKIGDDDSVTMRIRPSITDPLPKVTIGSGAAAVQITPISTREVILQDVRIKSGETLAIAGLTKENNNETVGKMPLISDIPVVGKIFQNKEYSHNKTELIILITPKVVDESPVTRI